MGATKIMVIRHAEKPAPYGGINYAGVDAAGTTCGADGEESLVTIGWERAGALVTLFAPPWGPKAPALATPQHIYASNPTAKQSGDLPSQRPYETVTAVAAKLGLTIDAKRKKGDYAKVVQDALGKDGVVLICWQHEDIPLVADGNVPGISRYILTDTGTTTNLEKFLSPGRRTRMASRATTLCGCSIGHQDPARSRALRCSRRCCCQATRPPLRKRRDQRVRLRADNFRTVARLVDRRTDAEAGRSGRAPGRDIGRIDAAYRQHRRAMSARRRATHATRPGWPPRRGTASAHPRRPPASRRPRLA